MKYSNLILKLILVGMTALAFGGCVAKTAPKTTYYELGYDKDIACPAMIIEKTPVYIEQIDALSMYDTREIFLNDGGEIKMLENSKFIARPGTMFYKSLSDYFYKSCDFRQVLDRNNAALRIKVKITKVEITPKEASMAVLVGTNGIAQTSVRLGSKKSIGVYSDKNALKALNEANTDLINQISNFIYQAVHSKI